MDESDDNSQAVVEGRWLLSRLSWLGLIVGGMGRCIVDALSPMQTHVERKGAVCAAHISHAEQRGRDETRQAGAGGG